MSGHWSDDRAYEEEPRGERMSADTKRARESAKYIDGLHWRTDQVGYASSLNGTTVAELIRALADEVDELRRERKVVWRPLTRLALHQHWLRNNSLVRGCEDCALIDKARAALGEDG